MGSWVTSLSIIILVGSFLLPVQTIKINQLLRRNTTFSWTTGRWGVCYSYDKCGKGEKERHVSCSDSEGFRALETNCDINTKPPTVTTCFRVCDEHRNHLRWKVGEWGPCLLPEATETSKIFKETTGRAIRTVTCIYTSPEGISEKVEGAACSRFDKKPDDTLRCSRDCPQDCIVTDFQPWTSCNGCEAVNRTKSRIVIVAPNAEGQNCPPLSIMEPCSNMAACLQRPLQKPHYLLKIGRWSQCIGSSVTKLDGIENNYQHRPVIGQRVRNITCLTDTGDIVDLSYCQHKHNYKTIETVENCIVSVNCVLSPWTEWNIQEEGCITSEGRIVPEIRTRSRRLLRLPEGNGHPCPPLYDKRVITSGLPPCDKYIWKTSEWGDCVVIHQQKIIKPLCGGGVQLRNLTCLRLLDRVPVSSLLCKESKPVTIQRCHIICSQDCKVSHWSQWSPCIPYKNDFFQISGEGYKVRSRSILIEPLSNGKECPYLYEVDLCDRSQLVMWKYGEWSSCKIHSHHTCGEGIQTRERQCIKLNGSLAVEAMCILHLLPPDDTATCYIPCPEDCVVSEWTSWSKCSVSCSDNHAGGEYFRNRTILAPNSKDGKHCPDKLFESDICNQDSCKGHKWKTLPWNECRISGNATCGEGIQVRRVLCIYDKEEFYVANKKCSGIPKPENKRSCTLPCPIDCSVTKFSEWSPCPDDCETDSYQYRQRYILQGPKFGGKPCPSLLKEERSCWKKNGIHCLKKSYPSKSYRWDIGFWSSCILPQSTHCGKGYQIRNITCIREDNRGVEPEMCLNSNFFLNDQIPSRSRRCYVSCEKKCAVSEWSEWSPCENACVSKTNRTRELLIDEYNIAENCKNQFQLIEEKFCPFPMDLSSVSSHWQECIVDENGSNITVNGKSIIGKCGTGQKYRQADGYDMKNCHQMGFEVDLCVVDCPRDCKLTKWSSWSVNNVSCGSVYRHRHRKIIHSANKFGRPCFNVQNGIENETKVENISCNTYSWLTGNWAQCLSIGICGNGTRRREISCAKIIDDINHAIVDERNCNAIPKPSNLSDCYLPCPKDCVVSEWSYWSECDKTCNNLHKRIRKRTILRHNSESGKPCPSLVDSENCLLGTNCFYYIWKVGNWSSCVLPEGAFCGEGKQKRAVWCIQNDGHFVDISKCTRNAQPLTEHIEKSCYVDCPIDCEVSEWSEWDQRDCQHCGLKKQMVRSRQVIQPPSERGQPCLQPLIQHKPCSFNPCFYWKISNWSECILKSGDCGYGTKLRTVQCVRQDDSVVSNKYCFLVNWTSPLTKKVDINWLALSYDQKELEECYIPCPGDCRMSDWSNWSHCHRDCSLAEIVGYQTRSRTIQLFPSNSKSEQCSDIFWESRPCWGGSCQSFNWKIKGNGLKCLRSDGLIVIGGCRHVAKPCYPPCKQPGMICNTTSGLCQCRIGNTSNKVSKCDMDPNETNYEEILLKYSPDDSETSIWMYAMITVGTAFVIFVAVTMYLMCHSTLRQRLIDIRRQAGVRRRVHNPPEVEKRCTYDD